MKLEPNAKRLAMVFRRMKRSGWKQSPIKGIKHSEFLVLVHLNRELKEGKKGLKISELSEVLQVTKPTVTGLVNSLEANNYVERTYDQNDRRVVRIQLSPYGKEQMKLAYDEYIALFNGLVETLGTENSQKLADLLEQTHHYFEHTCKKTK